MINHHTCAGRKLSIVLLCIGSLIGCSGEQQQTVFTGYVEAELVYIAAPQAGWINELPWQAGEQINANALAFALDNQQQSAAVQEAKARLEQAKALERNGISGARAEELAELAAQENQAMVAMQFAASEKKRWDALVEQGLAPASKASQVDADYSSSIAKLDTIKASIKVAKLGVRQELTNSAIAAQTAAQSSLDQTLYLLSQRQVISHIAGQVEELFYRQGEFVSTGKPVMAILPADALIVRFFVPQAALSDFNVGDKVRINADGVGAIIEAPIFHIARSAEFTPPVIFDQQSRQKLMFLVEARLPSKEASNISLRPGLPVEVSR
jgi:HlyD family secretion protein